MGELTDDSGESERLRTGQKVESAARCDEAVARLSLDRVHGRVGPAKVAREPVLELLHGIDLGDLFGGELDLERADIVVQMLRMGPGRRGERRARDLRSLKGRGATHRDLATADKREDVGGLLEAANLFISAGKPCFQTESMPHLGHHVCMSQSQAD